jgi:hypothetical protein
MAHTLFTRPINLTRHPVLVWSILVAGSFFLPTPGTAHAQTTILDDFESNTGRFAQDPDVSGTTAGVTQTTAGVGPSTSVRTSATAASGSFSMQLSIDDDPAVAAADGTAWRVRFLSGGGTPANNATLTTGSDAWVGYWVQTTTSGLRASILIDDGAALERGTRLPIVADGQWHLYQWNLGDAGQWDAFAGTGANGAIDASAVTIDALYFDAPAVAGNPDLDATLFVDAVSFNPAAPVPEPATVLALGAAGLGLGGLVRRRVRRRSDGRAS